MATRKAPAKMTYAEYHTVRQRAGWETKPLKTAPRAKLPPTRSPIVYEEAPRYMRPISSLFTPEQDTRPRRSKTPVTSRMTDVEIERKAFASNVRGGKGKPPAKSAAKKRIPADTRHMQESAGALRELEVEKTYFARERARAARYNDTSSERHYLHAYADAERRYLEHAQKHRRAYGTLAGTDPNEGRYRHRAPTQLLARQEATRKPSGATMASRRAGHVPQDR